MEQDMQNLKEKELERVRKVDAILGDIASNRQEVITRNADSNCDQQCSQISGQIGTDVTFVGKRLVSGRNTYECEQTEVDLEYLDAANQRQPLCHIYTSTKKSGSYITVAPKFGDVAGAAVTKTYLHQAKKKGWLYVYCMPGLDADVVLDDLYHIINQSKQKTVGVQKLSKFNLATNPKNNGRER